MSDNRPIGIFDSGLGGLTSVRAIKELLPNEHIIYFGDTARTPYGSKSVDTINKFAQEIVQFLIENDVKVIGIACNTVSASSLKNLKKSFPEMTFIDIIQPMVEASRNIVKEQAKIVVIGTEVTINSGMYEQKIKQILPNTKVISKACPLFVTLIEQGLLSDPLLDSAIHTYLDQIMAQEKPEYLILGCTHYPLISDRLQKFYPDVKILNPALSQAEATKKILFENNLAADPNQDAKYTFYASDLSDIFQNMIEHILADDSSEINFKELRL
ncbi:MAG: glutamate racemase [Clostridiaceae bacterium]|nr:glutamate racemase [Clostridiaceae bacterium]